MLSLTTPFAFYSLPESLIILALSFCDGLSIGRLDVASTSHNIRNSTLFALSHLREPMESFEHSALSLKYIFKRSMFCVRSIRMGRANLYEGAFDDVGPSYSSLCNWESVSLAHCLVNDTHLAALAKACGGRLRILNLSVCSSISDTGIITLTHQNPNILKLDLSITDKHLITDQCLVEGVAKYCRHLESLNLSHCYSITNKGIQSLAMRCVNLMCLDLTFCLKLSDIALTALASGAGAGALRELSLSDLTKVTSIGLVQIGLKCHRLTTLVLNYCRKITDEGLLAIAQGCRSLKVLDLNGCVLLTDAGVTGVSAHCSRIESLKLANCVQLTDAIALPLTHGCTNLRKLVLLMTQVSNEGKRDLVRGLTKLRGKEFDAIRKSLDVINRFSAKRKRSYSPEAKKVSPLLSCELMR